MANLGSLTLDLIANTQKFSSGLTRAERIAKKRSRAIRNSFRGIGIAIGSISFGAIVKSVTNTADELDKLSTRLGVSVEALSQLKFAADLSGVSFQTLSLGLQRSTRRIAEAAKGTGEAKDALKELGLNASELVRLSPDKQLEAIADAFLKVEGSADKVRLAMKLFDSEGVSFLQIINKGGAGLREFAAESDRLGNTLSRSAVDKMVQFKDTMTRLQTSIRGLAQTLVVSLGPTLIDVAEWFKGAAESASRFFAILGFGSDIQKADAAIKKITDRLFTLQNRLDEGMAGTGFLFDYQREGFLKEITDLNAQLEKQIRLRDELLNKAGDGPGAGLGGGGLLGVPSDESTALRDKWYSDWINLVNNQLRAEQTAAETRKKLAADVAKFKMDQERSIANSAVGFLQLLGTENKKFAIAAIVLQTALSLKEIAIQHVKTQGMLGMLEALAVAQGYAQLGPIGGAAAEAGIHARFAGLRALSLASSVLAAGLEVASAAVSIGNLNRSGSSLSGGVTGTANVDPVTGAPIDGSQSRIASTRVTINLGGAKLFSDDAVRELIERINDQIDDGVVVKSIMVA